MVGNLDRSARIGVLVTICSLGSACAPPTTNEELSQETDAVLNGLNLGDAWGYVSLQMRTFPSQTCTGITLSPQWILSAGHCIIPVGVINDTTLGAWATLDTNLLVNSNESWVHPNWFSNPSNPNNWDASYDVMLLRLESRFGTGAFPANHLTNQLSNRSTTPGDTLRVAGFGDSVVDSNGNGSGNGTLLEAYLTVSSLTNCAGGVVGHCTQPMIVVNQDSAGRQVYHGDSGGGAFTTSTPQVSWFSIHGINEAVTGSVGNFQGWLVDPPLVRPWVESIMHSPPTPLSLAPPAATPAPLISAAAWDTLDYVIATYTQGPNRIKMTIGTTSMPTGRSSGDTTSWTGWNDLSTAGLPAGNPLSPVGVVMAQAGALNGATNTERLAVVGSDGQMYLASTAFNTTPDSSWTNFTWTAAGKPPTANFVGLPAIGWQSSTRYDYLVLGSDGKLWTRSVVNSVLSANWTQVPSGTLTFLGSPGVSRYSSYLIAEVGNDSQSYTATFNTITNAWSAWTLRGGILISSIGVSNGASSHDLYGLGTNNHLYHGSFDPDQIWSGWDDLNTGMTFTHLLPYGPIASSRSNGERQYSIVTLGPTANAAPYLIRYPR